MEPSAVARSFRSRKPRGYIIDEGYDWAFGKRKASDMDTVRPFTNEPFELRLSAEARQLSSAASRIAPS